MKLAPLYIWSASVGLLGRVVHGKEYIQFTEAVFTNYEIYDFSVDYFTMCFWHLPNDLSEKQIIMEVNDEDGNRMFYLELKDTYSIGGEFKFNQDGAGDDSVTNTWSVDGLWEYRCIVHDGSGSGYDLYLNGVLDEDDNSPDIQDSGTIFFGAENDDHNELRGGICDFFFAPDLVLDMEDLYVSLSHTYTYTHTHTF